jgi:hypothetical protein
LGPDRDGAHRFDVGGDDEVETFGRAVAAVQCDRIGVGLDLASSNKTVDKAAFPYGECLASSRQTR